MSKGPESASAKPATTVSDPEDVASYQKALECLYNVFSRYGRPQNFEGCPCCTTEEHSRMLVGRPLRELSSDELEEYARKALTTWGTLNDYKYFLPRVMELTLAGSFSYCTEMMLEKLSYGQFPDWERVERQAVVQVLRSAWRDAVGEMNVELADAILCSVSAIVENISFFLDDADQKGPEFKDEYVVQCGNAIKRKLGNSFWKRDSSNYQRVLDWVYPAATP